MGDNADVLGSTRKMEPVPASEILKYNALFAPQKDGSRPPGYAGLPLESNPGGSGQQIGMPNGADTRTYISFESGYKPATAIEAAVALAKEMKLTDHGCIKIGDVGSPDAVVLYMKQGDPIVKEYLTALHARLEPKFFSPARPGIQLPEFPGVTVSPHNSTWQKFFDKNGPGGMSWSQVQEKSAALALARAKMALAKEPGAGAPLDEAETMTRARTYFGQCLRMFMIDPESFTNIPLDAQ